MSFFQPLTIRGLTVANRIVMSPMNRNPAPRGVPGEDIAQYYRRRVDGGVGLVVTGGNAVDHPAASGVYADRPCAVPELHGPALTGWQRVVDLVHAGGGKIVAQLWHLGVMRAPGTGYHPEVPSARPSGIYGPAGARTYVDPAFVAKLAQPGPELTDAEIVAIIAGYARSARNAIAIGFDAVEVHGANGYLPDAFMWEQTNRRTDRWGGGRRERTRFATELVLALRTAVGESVPVFYRISQWKHQDVDAKLAANPAEFEDVVGPLADAGVDVFDATQFDFDEPAFAGSPLNLAGWAKKLTGRAAMTVGAIGLNAGQNDPDAPEPPRAIDNLPALAARFARGEFDLAGAGRSLLNDPGFANRVRRGEPFVPFDPGSLRGAPR